MTDALSLPPYLALSIFIAACIAGANFRRIWAAEGPAWQLWASGLIAAIGLRVVALIPIAA